MTSRGEVLEAHDGFQLVVSYNPGYQSALKDLKHSTRQRFMALELTHPPADLEARIIQHESGVSEEMSVALAKLAEKARNLKDHGPSGGRRHQAFDLRREADSQGHHAQASVPGGGDLGADGRPAGPA